MNEAAAGSGADAAGAGPGGGMYWFDGADAAPCAPPPCPPPSWGGKYWRKCETSALTAAIKASAKNAKNF